MKIEVSERAMEDLTKLPDEVTETYLSKKEAMEKNLNIGATPGQAFDKFLSGMRRSQIFCIQENL